MKTFSIAVCAVMYVVARAAYDQSAAQDAIPVTVDNFPRAESDLYFSNMVKDGAFGKFLHRRQPATIENQTVIRLNRDTLYSSAVFDLDAGPVTITMPDSNKRFMSLMIIDEDHYVPSVTYDAGPHTFTKEQIGTRYIVAGVRTLVDPVDPNDVAKVHALQDGIKAEQNDLGSFEVPSWDFKSQKTVRSALITLSSTLPDFSKSFGTRQRVDPIRHLLGTAAAWGGNPDQDATYLNITPVRNDGATVYSLDVADVPVNGFWSVTVYNAEGYFEKNPTDSYSVNSVTAKKGAGGAISIRFGGCTDSTPNCIPIMKGWNYMVRLYQPRSEVLNGSWKFPEARPAS